jgi:hypothetical protein
MSKKVEEVRKTLVCKECGTEYNILEPVDDGGTEKYQCMTGKCKGDVEYKNG